VTSHTFERPAAGAALGLALLVVACVVTTYEGPGEPPQVAPRAPLPGLSEPKIESHSSPSSELSVGDAEPLSGRDAGAEPQEVSASHILVMYRGSMRAPPNVTRTKDEALARAKQALARARSGEDFGLLVAEYSDEPGAATRGGRLGRFRREQMVKPFADAAFKLKQGELSDIVETPFGFHIILRTE